MGAIGKTAELATGAGRHSLEFLLDTSAAEGVRMYHVALRARGSRVRAMRKGLDSRAGTQTAQFEKQQRPGSGYLRQDEREGRLLQG